MPGRFESAHPALSFSCRLVRILCSVIQRFVAAMLDAGHDFLLCRRVAPQFVRNDDPRDVAQALEQFAKEFLGGTLISPWLHQDVEHFPILINRAP